MKKLNNLIEKYPLLLKQGSDESVFKHWGFECGDGWYDIIDIALSLMMDEYTTAKYWLDTHIEYGDGSRTQEYTQKVDGAKEKLPKVLQVKEKFGALRIYLDRHDDRLGAITSFASQMSLKTCEVCGTTKDVTQTKSGWVATRCPEHMG